MERSYGGIVNPPCNRKVKNGNPLQAGAREVYPNKPGPRHRPTRQ